MTFFDNLEILKIFENVGNFENFENFGNFENFMQNVGKRISYKEKKRILSLDTIHESIDSGSGARGGKEKKAPIDCQNMSLTRNPEKKLHSLLHRIRKHISHGNAVFLLIF